CSHSAHVRKKNVDLAFLWLWQDSSLRCLLGNFACAFGHLVIEHSSRTAQLLGVLRSLNMTVESGSKDQGIDRLVNEVIATSCKGFLQVARRTRHKYYRYSFVFLDPSDHPAQSGSACSWHIEVQQEGINSVPRRSSHRALRAIRMQHVVPFAFDQFGDQTPDGFLVVND